jgi:hypothetical protein
MIFKPAMISKPIIKKIFLIFCFNWVQTLIIDLNPCYDSGIFGAIASPAPEGTAWTDFNATSLCEAACYYSDGLSYDCKKCDKPTESYRYYSQDSSCNNQSCIFNFTVESDNFSCPEPAYEGFVWVDNKCFYSDGASSNVQESFNSMTAHKYVSQDSSCNEDTCLMDTTAQQDPSCKWYQFPFICPLRKNYTLPTADNFPCKKPNPKGFKWVDKNQYDCLKDTCYYSNGDSFKIMDCDNSLIHHKYFTNKPSCNSLTCINNPNAPISDDFDCPAIAAKGFHWIQGGSCEKPGCYYSSGSSLNILDCANNNEFFQYSSNNKNCDENNCNNSFLVPNDNDFSCFTIAPYGFYWIESPEKNICYFSDGLRANFENFLDNTIFYKFFSQDGSCNKDTCGSQNSDVPQQNQFACVNPTAQGGLWSPQNEKCDPLCYYSDGINRNIINCNNPTMGHRFSSNHSSCNEFSCNGQLRITKDNFPCLWPAAKGFQWIEGDTCGLGVCYYSDYESLEINPCNGGYLRYKWSSGHNSCNRFTCTDAMVAPSQNDFLCNPLDPQGFVWDDSCNVCFYSDGIQGNLFNCGNNRTYTFSSSSVTCNKDTCYGSTPKYNNFLCGVGEKTLWFDNQCFYIGDNTTQPYQGENNFYQWVSQHRSCDGTTCPKVLNVKSNDFACVESSGNPMEVFLMVGLMALMVKFF